MTVLAFPASFARKDAAPMATASIAPPRSRRAETGEFRVLFVLTFMVCLVAALAGRMLPSSWRSQALTADGGKSIFGEARSAARAFVPFAFMG